MSIADKLALLADTKEALRVKLGLGVDVPFSEYANHAYALFSPISLFADGKQGVWYDPSDKSTLFQDVAGTIPVTKDGDPVGKMLDKSGNGNHAIQSISSSRPIYRKDTFNSYLFFDGTDDFMKSTYASAVTSPSTLALGIDVKSLPSAKVFVTGFSDGRHQISNTSAGLLGAYGGTGSILSDATKLGMNILVSHLNGTFSDLVDNNKVKKGSLSSNSIKGMTIGALWDGSFNVNADFYGIIQVEGLADTTDLQKYLRAKMGVI